MRERQRKTCSWRPEQEKKRKKWQITLYFDGNIRGENALVKHKGWVAIIGISTEPSHACMHTHSFWMNSVFALDLWTGYKTILFQWKLNFYSFHLFPALFPSLSSSTFYFWSIFVDFHFIKLATCVSTKNEKFQEKFHIIFARIAMVRRGRTK